MVKAARRTRNPERIDGAQASVFHEEAVWSRMIVGVAAYGAPFLLRTHTQGFPPWARLFRPSGWGIVLSLIML
jgi:hypothetical protein